ncbi:MAG: ribosome biogenesis GTP-binding protein YsxC [Acidimicrobiales bacterium]|nr:ribosome biogenesis GTP-binding protein YsxC [Acidimicrobiales bacterium]
MSTNGPLQLQFVTSGARLSDLPATPGEVAIVGRSNVGKSSLINALANRTQLAKVSKTPGRTQLLNLFALPDGRTVMDLPGYGFAAAPGSVRAGWSAMIEGYLLGRHNLRAVIVLVDAEVGPTKRDVEALEWLRAENLPIKIVATKLDKVKPSRRGTRQSELATGCGLGVGDIEWVSAAKNMNVDGLRRKILEWAGSSGQESRSRNARSKPKRSKPSTGPRDQSKLPDNGPRVDTDDGWDD